MRVAVVESGVVTGVLVLDPSMVVSADGARARGPAKQVTIDAAGNASEETYEAIFTAPEGCRLVQSDSANPGDTWTLADGIVAKPEPAAPVVVPATISNRQFFQQLAVAGTITNAEALAAVRTGALPAALAALVATLPQDQQFAVEMRISGEKTFSRAHPLTNTIGALQGMTSDQIDAFFIAASKL